MLHSRQILKWAPLKLKRNDTNELIYKAETDSPTKEQTYGYQKEIMSYAAEWVHPGIVILSEGNQTEKQKHHTTFLICSI